VDENPDEVSLSVSRRRCQMTKRPGSPDDFPNLAATSKKIRTSSTPKSEMVRHEGKITPATVQQTTSQILIDNVGATCNPPPALAAHDASLDERAMVNQEQKSSIHVAFRLSLRNIVTPILLDESLSGLWSESGQELLKLCANCPLPLTYNKDIVVHHLHGQQMMSAGRDDHMMATHVVLVHWHSVEMVLAGINPWLRLLENNEQLFLPPACWNIIFLEWKALGSLKEDPAESSHILMSFIQGYIECRGGRLDFFGRALGAPKCSNV
jgi:hypothetical protein